jgi:hypothetical protein
MALPIVSGATTDQLTVTLKKAALVSQRELDFGSAGGGFLVSGSTSAVVAAALAANTTLMSARFAAASSRKAYINKFQIQLVTATLGTAALVNGSLGLQKFTTATPTGGTARTPTRKNASEGSVSDMTDVRDSNAALTVTSVVFTDIPLVFINPASGVIANLVTLEWRFDLPFNQPLVLQAGDGICLRSQIVMPATHTWMYSYTMDWSER